MRVRPYGKQALLVEVADHEWALALYEDLRRDPPAGAIDIVPAACTVLVTFRDETRTGSAAAEIASRSIHPQPTRSDSRVAIPTVYDGPDLAAVAELTGLTVADVIGLHCEADYVVAFIGFAPGFGYLAGLDPRLQVPRRSDPRIKVPPGSVAIAGEFTAVYPGASPGGWHLLGTTTVELWNVQRSQPALLEPGTRVRFERRTA